MNAPRRAPERRGFGSQLIEGTIAYELRGTVKLRFEESGVVCEMVVPLVEEGEVEVGGGKWEVGGEMAG